MITKRQVMTPQIMRDLKFARSSRKKMFMLSFLSNSPGVAHLGGDKNEALTAAVIFIFDLKIERK